MVADKRQNKQSAYDRRIIVKIRTEAKNAAIMGVICSIAYMIVYFSRNILSVAAPEMLKIGYTTEYIGVLSTAFMITYAVGQLVNGIIGDYIKPKYMICVGLLAAAVFSVGFMTVGSHGTKAILYGLGGFALSMIYAPMTRVIAESLEYRYVTTSLMGLAVAAYAASPLVGAVAVFMNWKMLFVSGQILLTLSALMCGIMFVSFEKKGIITDKKIPDDTAYNEKNGKIKILLKRGIVQYSMVSVFTGILRTSVIFWIPTMLVQYMNYREKAAVGIFSVVSVLTAFAPYFGVWCYRFIFGKSIEKTTFLSFLAGAACYLGICIIKNPTVNVILLTTALFVGNIASAMLWNVYCPSLNDTGMVSGVTGYLDFISYIGGALANILFANAADILGWKVLLMVWAAIMAVGAVTVLPWNKIQLNKSK